MDLRGGGGQNEQAHHLQAPLATLLAQRAAAEWKLAQCRAATWAATAELVELWRKEEATTRQLGQHQGTHLKNAAISRYQSFTVSGPQ